MEIYQEYGCILTLEEALTEFYKLNASKFSRYDPLGGNLYEREMSQESQAFFRSHDIAHVIFACDISLLNEAMVKTWTAFGTTLGFWKHIAAYSRNIVQTETFGDIQIQRNLL